MNTHDLSRSQLDYLKCDYVSEVFHETVMYAGDMVDDDTIHEHYGDFDFSRDDFGFGPDEYIDNLFGREIHDGYGIERAPEFGNCFVVVIVVDDDTRLVINTHETEWPEARDAAFEAFENFKPGVTVRV